MPLAKLAGGAQSFVLNLGGGANQPVGDKADHTAAEHDRLSLGRTKNLGRSHRAGASFFNRHPLLEKRVSLGRTERARLCVVHFFAIKAQSSDSKLHGGHPCNASAGQLVMEGARRQPDARCYAARGWIAWLTRSISAEGLNGLESITPRTSRARCSRSTISAFPDMKRIRIRG